MACDDGARINPSGSRENRSMMRDGRLERHGAFCGIPWRDRNCEQAVNKRTFSKFLKK
jgi:hypothetical protein